MLGLYPVWGEAPGFATTPPTKQVMRKQAQREGEKESEERTICSREVVLSLSSSSPDPPCPSDLQNPPQGRHVGGDVHHYDLPE